jgi:hypothetical protein
MSRISRRDLRVKLTDLQKTIQSAVKESEAASCRYSPDDCRSQLAFQVGYLDSYFKTIETFIKDLIEEV